MDITVCLPVEVQERIFQYLDAESLSDVVQVCTLWNNVAMRLIRRRCCKEIPDDVVLEIFGLHPKKLISRDGVCPWDQIYLRWSRSKLKDPTSTNDAVAEIVQEEPFTCYKVTGDFVITSDRTGVVNLYDCHGQFVSTLASIGSDVWEVATMDVANKGPYKVRTAPQTDLLLEHDFIIVVGHCFVHLYHLQTEEGCPMSCVLVWSLSELASMSIAKTSVFGSTFAVAERPSVLNLRQVCLSPDGKVATITILSEITCHTWFWKWKIWGEKVICILATGEIAVWGLQTGTWLSVSPRYSELLYQNPCFIYRGVIFCSSRTSQSLLEYWHCFPGDSYWLVCWDGDSFQKYYPKLLMGDDVTAVCMKQRLVLIGTASGKLYCYEHTAQDSSIGTIWESNPVRVLQLAEHPIRSCDVSFDGNGTTVAARIKKSTLVIMQWPNRRGHGTTFPLSPAHRESRLDEPCTSSQAR